MFDDIGPSRRGICRQRGKQLHAQVNSSFVKSVNGVWARRQPTKTGGSPESIYSMGRSCSPPLWEECWRQRTIWTWPFRNKLDYANEARCPLDLHSNNPYFDKHQTDIDIWDKEITVFFWNHLNLCRPFKSVCWYIVYNHTVTKNAHMYLHIYVYSSDNNFFLEKAIGTITSPRFRIRVHKIMNCNYVYIYLNIWKRWHLWWTQNIWYMYMYISTTINTNRQVKFFVN